MRFDKFTQDLFAAKFERMRANLAANLRCLVKNLAQSCADRRQNQADETP
jgi:hypothetical protein